MASVPDFEGENRNPTRQPAMRLFFIGLLLGLVFGSCPHQRTDLTSASSAWGTPTAGQVELSSALSTSTELSCSVEFLLTEADTTLDLHAKQIAVEQNGILFIGSEDCPIESKITITLHSDWADPATNSYITDGMGVKCISATTDSSVDIHSAVRFPTWTYLGATATRDATTIQLAEAVEWVPGDQIVIASTDYERWRPQDCWDFFGPNCDFTANGVQTQSEVRTIISVAADGKSVTVDRALRFMHWGEVWSSGSDKVDTRGEVALLTRNIVVRGDISGNSGSQGFGSHMKFDEGSSARLTGVETYHAGQSMVLGRYPIHYHLSKNQDNSYVRYCSIHDTFQRALTLHWTNDLEVHGNVAFNTTGHMYFFEDALESNNNVSWNIGIHAHPHKLLGSDAEPAIFWVTYPLNDFEFNVAVGGDFGWWFAMPEHPVQLALNYEPWLFWGRFQGQGRFYRNTAHSQFNAGLFYDEGIFDRTGVSEGLTSYTPRDWQRVFTDTALMQSYWEADLAQPGADQTNPEGRASDIVFNAPYFPTLIEHFTAWKCRQHGIWHRGDYLWVVGARLADNGVGILMPGEANLAEDLVIVGETNNIGNPLNVQYGAYTYTFPNGGRNRPVDYDPWAAIKGWSFYDAGGPDIAINMRIYNFNDASWADTDDNPTDGIPPPVNKRSAGGIGGLSGPNALPPIGRLHNVQFSNVGNKFVHINNNYDDGSIGLAVQDQDGTLLGSCGAWAVSGYGVHLWDSGCTQQPDWFMYTCPASYRFLGIQIGEAVVRPPGCAAGDLCDLCTAAQQLVALVNVSIACSDRGVVLPIPANASSDVSDPGYAIYLQFLALLNSYSAKLYRLSDRAQQNLQADLDDDYTGYQVVNVGYNNNVKAQQEYLLMFSTGADRLGAPEDLLFRSFSGEHGEWTILGIPYHPSATINYLSTNYDGSGDNMAAALAVTSRADLRAATETSYFWDASAGILWIKAIFVEHGLNWDGAPYRYMYGLPQPELSVSIHIWMTCPGHNCTHPSFNPAAINPTTAPDPLPLADNCHSARTRATFSVTDSRALWSMGNFQLGFAPLPWAGVQFDSQGRLAWNMLGAAGVGVGYGWDAFGMFKQAGEPLNGATHLHLRLRCEKPNGDCYPALVAYDANYEDSTPVGLNHPDYIDNGPLTDGDAFQDVYVPLSELSVSGNFYGLALYPGVLWDQTRPYTLVIDRIELVTASRGAQPVGTLTGTGLYSGTGWDGSRQLQPRPQASTGGSVCTSDADCSGLTCSSGVCLATCTQNGECPAGQSCVTLSSSSFCAAACTADADCGSENLICDNSSCVPPSLVPGDAAPLLSIF